MQYPFPFYSDNNFVFVSIFQELNEAPVLEVSAEKDKDVPYHVWIHTELCEPILSELFLRQLEVEESKPSEDATETSENIASH